MLLWNCSFWSWKSVWVRSRKKGVTSVYWDVLTATVQNIPRWKCIYLKWGAFVCPVWSPGLFLIHTDLALHCVCAYDCTHSLFSLSLCTWIGQYVEDRGEGGSATVNKRRIVRKTGCYLWSPFYTTAVGVKPNWCFFYCIASTALQLNYSSMSESRQPLQTEANVTIMLFIGLIVVCRRSC